MRTPHNHRFLLILCVLFFLSTACTMPLFTAQPTRAPETANTMAAQTIAAMMTQIAAGDSATNTPGAPTPKPQEPTARPSATPQPGVTQIVLPTATNSPICDQAGFISDITVADGTAIPAGSQFVKTWRLRNEGTCTWSPDYAIVFDKGDSMSAPASLKLGESVSPGETIDISVTLTAPGSPGNYRGDWKLRNASGVLFGLGANSAGHFYVIIKVITPAATGDGFDFYSNACMAEWTGNGVALPCAGTDGNANGFVLYKSRPVLESGYIDDEPALLTNPPRVENGVIRGKFPPYTVTSDDYFSAVLSCENNAKNCNVRFQLDYQIDDGGIQNLATWNEAYDDEFHQVEVDLSSLAGKKVKFILTVSANGASNNDRALWLMPRIQN